MSGDEGVGRAGADVQRLVDLVRRLGAVVATPEVDGAVDFELPTGLSGFVSAALGGPDARVSFVITLDSPRDIADRWLGSVSSDLPDATLEALPSGSLTSIRLLVPMQTNSSEDLCWRVGREAVRLQAAWRDYEQADYHPDLEALQASLIRLVYPLGAAERTLEGELLLEDALAQLGLARAQWFRLLDDETDLESRATAEAWTEALSMFSLFLAGVRHGGF